MASLQFYGHHICGGFLIREDFVLTSAHCTRVIPMTVVLGAHNLSMKESSQQRIQVEEYFQHPKYRGEFQFDIMLLKLKEKAKLNKFVRTIDLPSEHQKPHKTPQKCTIAGWGRVKPLEDSSTSDVLRVAEEQTQFGFECKNKYKEKFNSEHMICTKLKKKGGSMCQVSIKLCYFILTQSPTV